MFRLRAGRKSDSVRGVCHYGCKRDNNGYMFEKLGADTGFDCINNYAPSAQMADFLNALSTNIEIPKTILYSLNPNDNASIGTIIGCFQEKFPGKIQPATVGMVK